jgi:hypothetical protein
VNRCHFLSLHAPKSASLRPFAFQIETEALPLVRAWARVWTLTPTPLHRSPDTTLFIWLITGLCKEIGTLNQPLNAKKHNTMQNTCYTALCATLPSPSGSCARFPCIFLHRFDFQILTPQDSGTTHKLSSHICIMCNISITVSTSGHAHSKSTCA